MADPNDLDGRLDGLFRRYRDACPDFEPGPAFMPELWQRIEARRNFTLSLGRWTRGLVTAAAAVCLLLGIFLAGPFTAASPVYTATYLDVLDSDASPDTLAYAAVLHDQPEGELQ